MNRNTIYRLKIFKIWSCWHYNIWEIFGISIFLSSLKFARFVLNRSWGFEVSLQKLILIVKGWRKLMYWVLRLLRNSSLLNNFRFKRQVLHYIWIWFPDHYNFSLMIKSVSLFVQRSFFWQLVLSHNFFSFSFPLFLLHSLLFPQIPLLDFPISQSINHVDFLIDFLFLRQQNLRILIFSFFEIRWRLNVFAFEVKAKSWPCTPLLHQFSHILHWISVPYKAWS